MPNRTTLARAVAAIGLLGIFAGGFAHAAKPVHHTSVVIVHGAFTDGSDWDKVIALLQAKGVDEKTTVAAWNGKPSWYIVSENDRMIQPDMERAMAKKIGAKVTILPTGHVPQLSRPADVAKDIIEAVAASEK